MFVSGIIMLGSTIYGGIKTYQQIKKKKKISSTKKKCVNPTSLRTIVTKIDTKYQHFVQRKIDPLFGVVKRQQQSRLHLNPNQVSKQEKRCNRCLALSGISLGFALVGRWFFASAILLSSAIGIYLLQHFFKEIYTTLVKERKVKSNLLIGGYLMAMLVTGNQILFAISYLFYTVSEKLIFRTEERSLNNLSNLFDQRPLFVWLLSNGVEIEVPYKQIKPKDKIVVNAGEIVPVDGIITDGIASIDQQVITGEAQPLEKEPGDLVLASTIVLSGRITIQVEKAGLDTTAAKIGKTLNNMINITHTIESKGIELGNKTALPLLLCSGLALPLVGPIGAASILGVSFGLTMRIIAPISMMNFLNIAAQNGVLVKDGKALERLKEVDVFVFDKTGTLTLDQPHVSKIHAISELTENELLTYAAAAEYRQTHPVAKAILEAAEKNKLNLPDIDEAYYEVGYGIKVKFNNLLIQVGSYRYMTLEGIDISPKMQTLATLCLEKGDSLVMISVNNELAGAIELHATIRPEAKIVIQQLQQKNITVAIVSGDQEGPTKRLAKTLGIENYSANILPEHKADLISQYQKDGHTVCFVGDGINDAIALKQADVSISLAGATSIAIDSAQIILMDKNLKQLIFLQDLANEFDSTIKTGFMTTVTPGIICIGGVFFLHFGLIASEILFQMGLFSGLGVAMSPLLRHKKNNNGQNKIDAP